MKASQTFTATLLVAMASNVFSVGGAVASIGRFSFDYAIVGGGRSKPIQVFDNGEETYMQFRQGIDIPAFFSASGDKHYMPTQEGPYIVIHGVPRDLIAQMGLSRTRITHASLATNAVQMSPDGRAVLPPATQGLGASSERQSPAVRPHGVQLASTTPVAISSLFTESARVPNSWQDNSYAQPRRGDEITWTAGVSVTQQEQKVAFVRGESRLTPEGMKAVVELAKRLARAGQVTVVGRDDDSFKEGLGEARARALKDVLIRSGIPRDLIVERTAAPVEGDVAKRGRQILVPSVVRWNESVPVQPRPAPAQVSTAQADVARQLATGSITPSQAIERLRLLAPATQKQDPSKEVAIALAMTAVSQTNKRPITKWVVTPSDGSIEGMLQRWAADAGWQLIWKSGPEVKITGFSELDRPDFLKAAEYVIAQAKSVGYRIKATAYSNNVLVVTEEEAK